MAKIPDTGKVTIADIAAEWEGPKDLAELSKKPPLYMSGTEQVGIDDFRGKFYGDPIQATGGTITDDGIHRYHTFTNDGAFEVTKAGVGPTVTDIDVLIVAAGGTQKNTVGDRCSVGGSGAGGYVAESFTASAGTKQVVVGGWANERGEDSSVTGQTVAKGGGAGASQVNPAPTWGFSGGSGGGAGGQQTTTPSSSRAGYNGVAGQGNKGGSNISWTDTYNDNQNKTAVGGGGGGGAGQAGKNSHHQMRPGSTTNEGYAGDGGNGKTWLNGLTYAGGGGGGYINNEYTMLKLAKGGTGGGGDGTCNYYEAGAGNKEAKSATFYGGGAGGGHSVLAQYGEAFGYQGIVIFRYRIAPDGTTKRAIQNHGHAPVFAPRPDYDPATHRICPNMIDDPNQETIDWTIVELTAEEKAAYAESLAAQGEEE